MPKKLLFARLNHANEQIINPAQPFAALNTPQTFFVSILLPAASDEKNMPGMDIFNKISESAALDQESESAFFLMDKDLRIQMGFRIYALSVDEEEYNKIQNSENYATEPFVHNAEQGEGRKKWLSYRQYSYSLQANQFDIIGIFELKGAQRKIFINSKSSEKDLQEFFLQQATQGKRAESIPIIPADYSKTKSPTLFNLGASSPNTASGNSAKSLGSKGMHK